MFRVSYPKIIKMKKPKIPFSFDGENYHSVENSKFYHKYNQIADYRGEALVTGCSSYNGEFECSIKTEIMDMATMKWSDAADYPFTSS